MLSSYACNSESSKGRLYPEKSTPYRNAFARDRDRIIHSNAFKRLQYKTQVFLNHEGDHYRNRLTHSIEVSTVARSIAKELGLSDDLAEAVSLAHDLGHTPFGHAGEIALNQCMKDYGGFSHNAHSLKILTKLEQKYASYDGLNLTWEVLEGIAKHNGPLTINIPEYIIEYNNIIDLDLAHYSSAEAQLASLSDDIAYICHDIEDGLKADVIHLNDLEKIECINFYIQKIKNKFPNLSKNSLIHEVTRELIHYLIESLLTQTRENLQKYPVASHYDVRVLNFPLIDFTEPVKKEIAQIKKFLFDNLYRHHRIVAVTFKCQKIIIKLFELYMDNTDLLPISWRPLIDKQNLKSQAGVIADYIAGMTDRFAINQYELLCNLAFDDIDY